MATLLITLTLVQFLYYFAWCALGQIFSIAAQQVKFAPRITKYGGFSIKVWMCENGWRVVLTIIAMIAGVAFTKQLTGTDLNELTAFFAGAFTDRTIDAITNRKK